MAVSNPKSSKKARKARSSPRSPLPKLYRWPAAVAVGLFCLAMLAYITIYAQYLGTALVLALILALLVACGSAIAYILEAVGSYGMVVLLTKTGISFIDSLSRRYGRQWKAIVDWGFVLSFGLLSVLIFKKYASKKMFAFGIVSIIAMQLFILPYLSIAYQIIQIPQLNFGGTSASSPYAVNSPLDIFGIQINAIGLVFTILSVIGGFALFILSELAYIAAIIIHGIVVFALSALAAPNAAHSSASTLPPPAGVPLPVIFFLDPSVIIPILLALIFLVVVHEFSHGVIARQSSIKIKNIGAALFGIIPIGALVDVDEKGVSKLPAKYQDKISIAGVSLNFFLTIVFFALFLLIIYVVVPPLVANSVYIYAVVAGSPAQHVIPSGAIVYKWNGYKISNISNLKVAAAKDLPYSTVNISTNYGNYSVVANATGKIGVELSERVMPKPGIIPAIGNFIYEFIGLSFMLNFYVAIFNILPIPLFDGWRIYKLKLGSKSMRIITIAAVIILIMLFVPFIWYH
ncbi:MAG: M50 family metallopeptidase [Candidatus Micrarchaeaceae archaeon]